MVHPWLQGSCVLSWLQHKSVRSINVSRMEQYSPAFGIPLHCVRHPLLMLFSLCPSSHDCFWFLSWGGKPSLSKKVLPRPTSLISVFCSQMSYWSGSGSLERCFQTAEAAATWRSDDETRMIICISYEEFLQSQPGRGHWVAKAWLRSRTDLKTEKFAHQKVSQASVWCRWVICNKCQSIDLCFLQYERNRGFWARRLEPAWKWSFLTIPSGTMSLSHSASSVILLFSGLYRDPSPEIF